MAMHKRQGVLFSTYECELTPQSGDSNSLHSQTLNSSLTNNSTASVTPASALTSSTLSNVLTTLRKSSVSNIDHVTTREERADVGSSVTFTCSDSGHRNGTEWYKYGTDNHAHLLTDFRGSNTLVIDDVTIRDSGIYKCVLNNTQQSWMELKSVQLIVIPNSDDATSPVTTEAETYTGLPKYSGIGIGMGVCLGLLLLSGGAVLLLNFTNNGGMSYCLRTICGPAKKDDSPSLSRLQVERTSLKNANMRILPFQRMQLSNNANEA